MFYELTLLADMPPPRFDRAWKAVEAEWSTRGWDDFLKYFRSTWIENLKGWNAGHLGVGTPRTADALEGAWPTIHTLITVGRVSPIRLGELLMDKVVPYYLQNKPPRGLNSVSWNDSGRSVWLWRVWMAHCWMNRSTNVSSPTGRWRFAISNWNPAIRFRGSVLF